MQLSVQQELDSVLDRLKDGLDPAAYDKVLELMAADDVDPGNDDEPTRSLERVK